METVPSERPADDTSPYAIAQQLAVLAELTRLRILALLEGRDLCVCDIHHALRVSQSTVSRHLAYLRHVGFVAPRREGLWIHYHPSSDVSEPFRSVIQLLVEAIATSRECQADRRRLAALPQCCEPNRRRRPIRVCAVGRTRPSRGGAR